LGNKACKALALVDYLTSALAAGEKDLILVGDIIDDHQTHLWPISHGWALQKMLEFKTVRYIPGNHDSFMRSFVGRIFLKVEIYTEYRYLASNGKRYLVTHGDLYDPWIQNTRFISVSWLIKLSRSLFEWLHTILLSSCGHGYRARLCEEAKSRGFDGVICGHIHLPEISDVDGIHYLNCGDWIDNRTALVDRDGEFRVVWANDSSSR
jgi:UDP-2,3-diacylglucosamine pyrophosphatase LpxH